MADIPDPIVTAALATQRRLLADRPDPMALSEETLMRMTLEGVAVPLGEHVASRILAHMEAHQPKAPAGDPDADVYDRAARVWRRHLRLAARIAARAFLTEDDEKRLAAQALARGDYVACEIPEVPGE